MKSTVINLGTVMVDGKARTLSHALISVGDEKRCGATQYHELAYHIDRANGVEVEVIDSHLNSSGAETLFSLLNSRKVCIDTRIELSYSEIREPRCFACGSPGCDEAPDCAI